MKEIISESSVSGQEIITHYTTVALDMKPSFPEPPYKIKNGLITFEAKHHFQKMTYKPIQCKYTNGLLQLTFLNRGLLDLLQSFEAGKDLYGNHYDVPLNKVIPSKCKESGFQNVVIHTTPKAYRIAYYSPLTTPDMDIFRELPDWKKGKLKYLESDTGLFFLEGLLRKHIGFLLRAIDRLDLMSLLNVRITKRPRHFVLKHKKMVSCFDVSFFCNLELPNELNLGVRIAYGFGGVEEIGSSLKQI